MFKDLKLNKTWLRIFYIYLISAVSLKMYMADAWTGGDDLLAIIISMVIGWNLYEGPTKKDDEKE